LSWGNHREKKRKRKRITPLKALTVSRIATGEAEEICSASFTAFNYFFLLYVKIYSKDDKINYLLHKFYILDKH